MLIEIVPNTPTPLSNKMVYELMVYFYLTRIDADHIVRTSLIKGKGIIPKTSTKKDLEKMINLCENCGFLARESRKL